MVTRRPRDFSRLPRLEAVSPLPSEEATPPVTNTCLVGWLGAKVTPVVLFASDCGESRASRLRHLHGVQPYQDFRRCPDDSPGPVTGVVGPARPPHRLR